MSAIDKSVALDKDKTYIIRSFKDRKVALRMLSMGILPGQKLRLIHKSPFGKSYYISVGSRWLAVRLAELLAIEWSEQDSE